jgi:hypothetical protein
MINVLAAQAQLIIPVLKINALISTTKDSQVEVEKIFL